MRSRSSKWQHPLNIPSLSHNSVTTSRVNFSVQKKKKKETQCDVGAQAISVSASRFEEMLTASISKLLSGVYAAYSGVSCKKR